MRGTACHVDAANSRTARSQSLRRDSADRVVACRCGCSFAPGGHRRRRAGQLAHRRCRQATARVAKPADRPRTAAKQHIQELIRQLGDPRYAARRAAASELRQIGAEAFDSAARRHRRLRPRSRRQRRYLLRQIAVRWVQSDDPPRVRRLAARLRPTAGQRAAATRRASWPSWPDGEGVAGLCRIARFDRSPLVSRMAALAIIRPTSDAEAPAASIRTIVERELGASTRTAADWLRQYLVQLRDPAASVAALANTDRRGNRPARSRTPPTRRPRSCIGLLWNLADVHRQLGNQPAHVRRRRSHDRTSTGDASETTAVELLTWLDRAQIVGRARQVPGQASGAVGAKQAAAVLRRARPREAGQSRDGRAVGRARRRRLDPQATLESFVTAKDLEEHSQFDWAVREYRRVDRRQEKRDRTKASWRASTWPTCCTTTSSTRRRPT